MAEKTAGDSVDKLANRNGISLPNSYPGMPVIDYDYYLALLEESDAPLEQKRELIETLFGIMMGFADIAFGLSPTQNTCGQLTEIESERRIPDRTMVELENSTTRKQFKKAAKGGHQ